MNTISDTDIRTVMKGIWKAYEIDEYITKDGSPSYAFFNVTSKKICKKDRNTGLLSIIDDSGEDDEIIAWFEDSEGWDAPKPYSILKWNDGTHIRSACFKTTEILPEAFEVEDDDGNTSFYFKISQNIEDGEINNVFMNSTINESAYSLRKIGNFWHYSYNFLYQTTNSNAKIGKCLIPPTDSTETSITDSIPSSDVSLVKESFLKINEMNTNELNRVFGSYKITPFCPSHFFRKYKLIITEGNSSSYTFTGHEKVIGTYTFSSFSSNSSSASITYKNGECSFIFTISKTGGVAVSISGFDSMDSLDSHVTNYVSVVQLWDSFAYGGIRAKSSRSATLDDNEIWLYLNAVSQYSYYVSIETID